MKDPTRAVTAGRRTPAQHAGTVSPPVYRASTILFDSYEAFRGVGKIRKGDGVTYATHGTPGTHALESAIAELEGGHRTRLCSSGATALAAPLLSMLEPGDHVLIPDCCYGNLRDCAKGLLTRLGMQIEFYNPLIGGGIRGLIRPNTRVVCTESPGSQTFDVQDIPAIAAEAKAAGAWVMMDNTWASPLYFKPFEHGVDVSIQAATKYIAGHADLLMGAVTCTEAAYDLIQQGWYNMGLCVSGDDAFLAARGVRTMPLRLERHWQTSLTLGDWLMARAEVAEVIHPAMPHDPGHALWARDFRGAGGLFGFVPAEAYRSRTHQAAFVDALQLFGLGFSWGGFQSMVLPAMPTRTASPWPRPGRPGGVIMRLFAGLEDPGDLIDDLAQAFAAMRAV